jgi:RES domain-containing protein
MRLQYRHLAGWRTIYWALGHAVAAAEAARQSVTHVSARQTSASASVIQVDAMLAATTCRAE